MFDVKSGTSKTREEMNRGFYDQGLTAEAVPCTPPSTRLVSNFRFLLIDVTVPFLLKARFRVSDGREFLQEEIVVREALLEAPALWWESIGSVFNHSAFDVLSEWRERKVRCLFYMFFHSFLTLSVGT